MTRLRADLMLLACAAVWGFAFFFQKRAMTHLGPLLFIAARSLLALTILVPLALREWRTGARQADKPRLMRLGMLSGLAFFGGAVFQQTGIVTATVTNSGFLTSLYVVITPFVAWIVYRLAPKGWVWLAVGLSAFGTWLLGGASFAAFSTGDVLVAVSAVFWAVHVVLVGMGSSEEKPATFTALQFAVVGFLGTAAAVMFESVEGAALLRAAPDLAFVGLLSSALTFTLFAAAMQYVKATETAVIVSTESLFAALAAWLFLGEKLSAVGWSGAGLLILATIVVHLPPLSWSSKTPSARLDKPGAL